MYKLWYSEAIMRYIIITIGVLNVIFKYNA